MLELTLTKPMHRKLTELAAAPRSRGRPAGWLLGLWRAAARHAERPGRYVPYC